MLVAGVGCVCSTCSCSTRYLTFTATNTTSIKIAWTNGNGDGRIVVVKTTEADWTATDAAVADLAVAPTRHDAGVFDINTKSKH